MYFTSIRWLFNKDIFFFLFFGVVSSYGQIIQKNRVDIPLLPFEYNYFKIASFKEKGLLLYRALLAPDANYIEFKKLDTLFNEKWSGTIPLDRNQFLFKVKAKEGFLVLLFWNKNSSKQNFQALLVNEAKSSYVLYEINNAIPFNPTDFEITGSSLIIGGYINLRPIVLHYSFSTKVTKVLPGYFNEPGEITQIKTYRNGNFDIIVRVKNQEKRKSLWFRSYTMEGNLISSITLTPEKRKNFIYGKSIQLANGNQLIAGTYGRTTEYAQGIFISVADTIGRSKINYYNFGKLKNFFSFMRARKEARIKSRIERRTLKGKQVRFNYKIIVHDLIPYKNQFLLVGESYFPHFSYPTYSTRSLNTPSFGLNPYLNSNSVYRGDYVFDGYQYTHAFIVGFNRSANLLWDNCFEINDLKNMQLEEFVKVLPSDNQTTLLYLFENSIHSKIINDSIVVMQRELIPIKVTNDNYETPRKDGDANALTYWYNNYFIASGVQRLRDKKLGKYGPEQRVFYLSKIKTSSQNP